MGRGGPARGPSLEYDNHALVNRWRELLESTGVNTDHVEPGELASGTLRYYQLAADAWISAIKFGWVTVSGLTESGQGVARIAERRFEDRTEQDLRTLEETIAESLRTHYRGRDDLPIVDLVLNGAEMLARSKHVWSSYVPGLLLVEFEALTYWSFVRPRYALELRDRLVTTRDTAMHRHGWPSPDVDPIDNVLRLADATADLYLETQELAAGTDLTVTAVRSTAMLFTFCGLLEEFSLGPVNYLIPFQAGESVNG